MSKRKFDFAALILTFWRSLRLSLRYLSMRLMICCCCSLPVELSTAWVSITATLLLLSLNVNLRLRFLTSSFNENRWVNADLHELFSFAMHTPIRIHKFTGLQRLLICCCMNLTVIFPRAHADYGSDDVEFVMCVEDWWIWSTFPFRNSAQLFTTPQKTNQAAAGTSRRRRWESTTFWNCNIFNF